MLKFDLSVILIVAVLYCINRFCLKQIIDFSIISYILKCHFNDFLAGIGFIAYLNCLFFVSKFNSIRVDKMSIVVCIEAFSGVLWEYILPMLFRHGTSDIWDILAYILGGMAYIVLEKIPINVELYLL